MQYIISGVKDETFRRIAHPVHKNITRYFGLIKAKALHPTRLSLDANARKEHKLNKQIYKNVALSLQNLSSDGESLDALNIFDIKNLGLFIIAEKVEKTNDNLVITILDGQGTVNGGHTGDIIWSADPSKIPEDQYVLVQIITGIPKSWTAEISGAVNTTVQVKEVDLAELDGLFEPYHSTLSDIEHLIAYRADDNKPIGIVEILQLQRALFADNPHVAYTSKGSLPTAFKSGPEPFLEQLPILKDIMKLRDFINFTSHQLYQNGKKELGEGGAFGKLGWVKQLAKKTQLPILGKETNYELLPCAMLPLISSFYPFLEKNSKGQLTWDYKEVTSKWQEHGFTLLNDIKDAFGQNNNSGTALGKDVQLWKMLRRTFFGLK